MIFEKHMEFENILKEILEAHKWQNIECEKNIPLDESKGKYRADIYAVKDSKAYLFEIKMAPYGRSDIFSNIISILKLCGKEYHIVLILPMISTIEKEGKFPKDIEIWDSDKLFLLIKQIKDIKKSKNLRSRLLNLYKVQEVPIKKEPFIEKDRNVNNAQRAKGEDNEDKRVYLLNNLDQIKTGWSDATNFEKYIMSFLDYVFDEDIANHSGQLCTSNKLHRFDSIARINIKSDTDSFFHIIQHHYNTRYIIFECKNYNRKISQREVYLTTKYLCDTALRNVAILFARKGADKKAHEIRDGILRENKKLIIFLDDNDIISMVKDRNRRNLILINKLDDLLMKMSI